MKKAASNEEPFVNLGSVESSDDLPYVIRGCSHFLLHEASCLVRAFILNVKSLDSSFLLRSSGLRGKRLERVSF
ncbi:hypothetical protein MPTK2_2g20560 [Marchantia polymorpha subsp. ruderalis]